MVVEASLYRKDRRKHIALFYLVASLEQDSAMIWCEITPLLYSVCLDCSGYYLAPTMWCTYDAPSQHGGVEPMQVILDVNNGICSPAEDCKDSGERPAARFAHAACVVKSESTQCVCVFGGVGEETDYQDIVSWTPSVGKDSPNF